MPDEQDTYELIEAHRAQIDAIDLQLVDLLNRRAQHQLAIRELKLGAHLGLFDSRREAEIYRRVESYNNGPLYPDNLHDIYTTILKVSKEMPSA